MKKIHYKILIPWIFFIFFITWIDNLHPNIQNNLITIQGIVLESDWDEKGNVIAVAICVTLDSTNVATEENSETYWVADTEKGKELFNYIEKNIKATGTISIDEFGYKNFSVNEFEILE